MSAEPVDVYLHGMDKHRWVLPFLFGSLGCMVALAAFSLFYGINAVSDAAYARGRLDEQSRQIAALAARVERVAPKVADMDYSQFPTSKGNE